MATVEAILPSTKVLSGRVMVQQFGTYLRSQVDMRVEARNLDRFSSDFQHTKDVRFPEVIRPWVRANVLIETFEPSMLLSDYLEHPTRIANWDRDELSSECPREGNEGRDFRYEVADKASTLFLSSVFETHFMHGDLHPGNVKIKTNPTEVILLDCGLCIKVTQRDARNLADVLKAFVDGDGCKCAQLIIDRSPGDSSNFRDEDGFVRDVAKIVDDIKKNSGIHSGQIRIAEPISQFLRLACRHHIVIEPNFVSIIIATCVCEGLAKQLAPEMNLFQKMIPYLAQASARHWYWFEAA